MITMSTIMRRVREAVVILLCVALIAMPCVILSKTAKPSQLITQSAVKWRRSYNLRLGFGRNSWHEDSKLVWKLWFYLFLSCSTLHGLWCSLILLLVFSIHDHDQDLIYRKKHSFQGKVQKGAIHLSFFFNHGGYILVEWVEVIGAISLQMIRTSFR